MKIFGGNEELQEAMAEMFRVGIVNSIDPQKGTARVRFPDDDDVISYDLQVLHRNTFRNKDYNMPDIGEDVLCLFLANGLADGFVLGSVYAGEVIPPEAIGDKRTVVFADASRFSYDRVTHQMEITIGATSIIANPQSVIINTPVSVDVVSGQSITANAGVDITAVAGKSVVVSTPGKVQVTAGEEVQITAPSIVLNGNVQVNGMVTASGDIISDRVSLQTHVHTGNQNSPTSPPIKPQ